MSDGLQASEFNFGAWLPEPERRAVLRRHLRLQRLPARAAAAGRHGAPRGADVGERRTPAARRSRRRDAADQPRLPGQGAGRRVRRAGLHGPPPQPVLATSSRASIRSGCPLARPPTSPTRTSTPATTRSACAGPTATARGTRKALPWRWTWRPRPGPLAWAYAGYVAAARRRRPRRSSRAAAEARPRGRVRARARAARAGEDAGAVGAPARARARQRGAGPGQRHRLADRASRTGASSPSTWRRRSRSSVAATAGWAARKR